MKKYNRKIKAGLFIFSSSIVLLSCQEVTSGLDEQLNKIDKHAEELDSAVNRGLDKVESLDSTITAKSQKIKNLDSIVRKTTKRIDSLVSKSSSEVNR